MIHFIKNRILRPIAYFVMRRYLALEPLTPTESAVAIFLAPSGFIAAAYINSLP